MLAHHLVAMEVSHHPFVVECPALEFLDRCHREVVLVIRQWVNLRWAEKGLVDDGHVVLLWPLSLALGSIDMFCHICDLYVPHWRLFDNLRIRISLRWFHDICNI